MREVESGDSLAATGRVMAQPYLNHVRPLPHLLNMPQAAAYKKPPHL